MGLSHKLSPGRCGNLYVETCYRAPGSWPAGARVTLKSGRSGKKVTNRKQAIAIDLSEVRKKTQFRRRKRVRAIEPFELPRALVRDASGSGSWHRAEVPRKLCEGLTRLILELFL